MNVHIVLEEGRDSVKQELYLFEGTFTHQFISLNVISHNLS